MIRIPVSPSPFFGMSIPFEGRSFLLDLRWNSRGEFWVMSLFTDLGEPIVQGVKLVLAYPLLSEHPDERLPPGEFYAIAPEVGISKMSLVDFQTGHTALLYMTEEESVGAL